MKFKKYITILLHRTCLYGMKIFIHQIGCQYKSLLDLKYKQVNRQKNKKDTLLAYHNTEFEALFIVTTTQAG